MSIIESKVILKGVPLYHSLEGAYSSHCSPVLIKKSKMNMTRKCSMCVEYSGDVKVLKTTNKEFV